MTAQTPELFVFNGRPFETYDEPLRPLLEARGIDRIEWCGSLLSSACWRGYVGTWHIVDRRLYLIDLTSPCHDESDIRRLFPECDGRVFAHWFTGVLNLPFGEVVASHRHSEMPVASEAFESFDRLGFVNGILVSQVHVANEFPLYEA
jgi:hypothetical protein